MPPNLVASRDFVQHHFPRHSTNGSKRSRASSTHSPVARLSIIEEDGDTPSMPPKAHHRPFHRRWNLGDPPRISFEKSPPKYSVWDATGPKGEKLSDMRNNKHIARRGGWKRFCLLALLTIAVIVSLAVGLVFGLRKNHRFVLRACIRQVEANTQPPVAKQVPHGLNRQKILRQHQIPLDLFPLVLIPS